MNRASRGALLALLALGACSGRRREHEPRPKDLPAVHLAREARAAKHPRLLLTDEVVARIQNNAKLGTPLWRGLERECGEYMQAGKSGGYQGLQWAEAIGDLSVCFYATGRADYRDRAVMYLRALLYDKREIGDGEGGDEVVHGDHGYPIRGLGVYAALAYDWLHDAPGMAELRPVILDRLHAWLRWYEKEGYLNDSPYSNYFWGYLAALTVAGLATDGESDDAAHWLAESKRLLDDVVIPAFWTKLKGGEWAEGWQYGSMVAMEVAMVVEAYRTARGADYAQSFPWLGELVPAFAFRIVPGKRATYGNATQEQRPAPADGFALAAALVVLGDADPKAAAGARYLLGHVYPPLRREHVWFPFLAEAPDGAEADPRAADQLSYQLAGPGRTFLRSSWQDDAVWVGFQAGPRIAVDHQHNDQGHLEIWRGNDPLLADFGAGPAFATINHNTLLIDDGNRINHYSPNQGLWNRDTRTVGFTDDGKVAVLVGDLTSAWNPKCVEDGCEERVVAKVTRTVVYVRPGVIVTDDRVTLNDGGDGVTWVAHTPSAPTLTADRASATVGASAIDVVALAPDKPAGFRAPKEPTPTEDHNFRADRPSGEVWRIEIETPRGDAERHLVTWIAVGAAGTTGGKVERIAGQGLRGGAGTTGAATVAVLTADGPAGGSASIALAVDTLVVVGLEPGRHYQVDRASEKGCMVRVTPAATGSSVASEAGALVAAGCAGK